MTSNGKRLGELLLHADVITKRQFAKAIQRQQRGDKRKLGEILIDLHYITVEDITEIMIEQATEVKSEQKKSKPVPVSEPAVVTKEKNELRKIFSNNLIVYREHRR